MSISEQAKELRDCVNRWKNFENVYSSEPFKLLSEAADTIESLSAKLQAANMEQSAENCGGWIPCSERMPEENKEVICCFESGVVRALVLFNRKFCGKVYAYEKSDIIAWQPLPEPYHEP